MACYHPSKINVQRRSMLDIAARSDSVTVPCGKCLGCRADQAREWSIRVFHESQLHPLSSWFVTLTYNDEHLPGQWPDDDRTLGTLCTDDVTRFLKRLRKRYSNKLGYFLCGEYGERTARPHYHMAIFGAEFLDKQQVGVRNDHAVFRSVKLEKAWGMGNCEITGLSPKSASYVTGYVTKKVKESADPQNHIRVDENTGELFEVEPEFQRMSRNPALGRRWLETYYREVYPSDFVVMDGNPFKPPRYYDKLMERINPVLMEEVRYQRFKDAEEIGDDKLIMKEKVHRARVRLFENRGRI